MLEQVIGEVELEVRKEPCAKGRCRCVNDRVFLPFVTEFKAMKCPAPKLFGGLDRPGVEIAVGLEWRNAIGMPEAYSMLGAP